MLLGYIAKYSVICLGHQYLGHQYSLAIHEEVKMVEYFQTIQGQERKIISYSKNTVVNGVFSKWSKTFSEFREFRESEKSLRHELGSV